jgi:hypothetical protein
MLPRLSYAIGRAAADEFPAVLRGMDMNGRDSLDWSGSPTGPLSRTPFPATSVIPPTLLRFTL